MLISLQAERNDDDVWDVLLDKTTDISAFYNINQASLEERGGSNTNNKQT